MQRLSVLVFGAGSIGCYVGGLLAAAGADVTFVGRRAVGDEIADAGVLRLTDLDDGLVEVTGAPFRFIEAPDAAAADADLVLVTVKALATEAAGRALAPLLPPGTVVISLQNGIGNAETLTELLPNCVVSAGTVLFNVAKHEAGHFHRGTTGGLAVQDDPALDHAGIAAMFAGVGLPLDRHEDLRPVQWAKLLLNLNNAVNALSGKPLKQQLSQRGYRSCLALAQREALDAMDRAGIRPARLTPIPPRAMTRLLTAPDRVFRRAAARVIAIDPLARSSMADDLAAGRETEIDWLCGEVVRLGDSAGHPTPINRRLVDLIRAAESGGRRDWSADDLLRELRRLPT